MRPVVRQRVCERCWSCFWKVCSLVLLGGFYARIYASIVFCRVYWAIWRFFFFVRLASFFFPIGCADKKVRNANRSEWDVHDPFVEWQKYRRNIDSLAIFFINNFKVSFYSRILSTLEPNEFTVMWTTQNYDITNGKILPTNDPMPKAYMTSMYNITSQFPWNILHICRFPSTRSHEKPLPQKCVAFLVVFSLLLFMTTTFPGGVPRCACARNGSPESDTENVRTRVASLRTV